mmetsp:Transcript_48602/g.114049  ORF Transcript_48602/g.114049 Transcript_48602/m.114049 type:complete len:253 (-) Transcript_48602:535-1293(-)
MLSEQTSVSDISSSASLAGRPKDRSAETSGRNRRSQSLEKSSDTSASEGGLAPLVATGGSVLPKKITASRCWQALERPDWAAWYRRASTRSSANVRKLAWMQLLAPSLLADCKNLRTRSASSSSITSRKLPSKLARWIPILAPQDALASSIFKSPESSTSASHSFSISPSLASTSAERASSALRALAKAQSIIRWPRKHVPAKIRSRKRSSMDIIAARASDLWTSAATIPEQMSSATVHWRGHIRATDSSAR